MVDRRPSNFEIDEAKVLSSAHSKSPESDPPKYEERLPLEELDKPPEESDKTLDEEYCKDPPVEDYGEEYYKDSPVEDYREEYYKDSPVEDYREDSLAEVSPAKVSRKVSLAEENSKPKDDFMIESDSETESKRLVESQSSEKIEVESKRLVESQCSEKTEVESSMVEETKSIINTSDTDACERNEPTNDSHISTVVTDMPPERPSCIMKGEFDDINDRVYPNTPANKEEWKSSSPPLPLHQYNTVYQPKSNTYFEEEFISNSGFGLTSTHHELEDLPEDKEYLLKSFEATKEGYLTIIHEYDPTFKFKESGSNVRVQQQMSDLNLEFCNKCEQLTEKFITDTKNENKEKLKMRKEIEQFEESTKELEITCSELEEALKKTNLELDIDSDNVYLCYNELRNQVYNYLCNQNCYSPERVNSMIEILLDNIICCHPYQPLIEIENLFTDSLHEDWIPHTRNQIISSLLKQDKTPVDSQLIIKIFGEDHNISLKSNESLEIAIKNAYTLSKYAIAKKIYFKDGLSVNGLSLLKKKENVITEKPKPMIKPTTNMLKGSTSPTRFHDGRLPTTQETENLTQSSANAMKDPQKTNQNYKHPDTMGKNQTPPSNQQKINTPEQIPMYEWRIHVNNDPFKNCYWCRVHNSHRLFEKMNPEANLCRENFLCDFCKIVRAHELCSTKSSIFPGIFQSKSKCHQCQLLNQDEKKAYKKADNKAEKKAEKKEKKNQKHRTNFINE